MTYTQLHDFVCSRGEDYTFDYASIHFEKSGIVVNAFTGETFAGLSKIRAIALLNRLEKEFHHA